MNLLEAAGLASLWAADRSALQLARERTYYRPISLVLLWTYVADVLATILRQGYLSTQPRPYQGLARLLFHVEQAAGLVWPVGVAAVALMVLARRPAWPAFVAGGAVLLARVALYPWLRGDRLAWLLLAEQVALVALGAWAWRRFKREARPVRIVDEKPVDLPAPWLQEHHKAVGVILAIELAMLFGPHLVGVANGDGLRVTPGNPFKRWPIAQILYSALFTGLAIQQRRWTWKALESSGDLSRAFPSP